MATQQLRETLLRSVALFKAEYASAMEKAVVALVPIRTQLHAHAEQLGGMLRALTIVASAHVKQLRIVLKENAVAASGAAVATTVAVGYAVISRRHNRALKALTTRATAAEGENQRLLAERASMSTLSEGLKGEVEALRSALSHAMRKDQERVAEAQRAEQRIAAEREDLEQARAALESQAEEQNIDQQKRRERLEANRSNRASTVAPSIEARKSNVAALEAKLNAMKQASAQRAAEQQQDKTAAPPSEATPSIVALATQQRRSTAQQRRASDRKSMARPIP